MAPISDILNFLMNYLIGNNPNPWVEIANIATLNDGDEFISSNSPIILSLINIEEEPTLKNSSIYNGRLNGTQIEIQKQSNPTKYLNIGVLFTAYFKTKNENNNYQESIKKLESIIQSFQNKCVFKESENIIGFPSGLERIYLEMQSLKMEELHQMWGILGSRYFPSVLYRIRIIPIESSQKENVGVIEKIQQIIEE